MYTPPFIRVHGHVYRKRTEQFKLPPFIQVEGRLYRLAQHAELLVAVVDAIEKVTKLFEGFVATVKNERAREFLQGGVAKLQKFGALLAKGDPKEQAEVLGTAWPIIRAGLVQYASAFNKVGKPNETKLVLQHVKDLDTAINSLSTAEGLDFVGKELGGEQQKSTVDWSAAKQTASAPPPFIKFDGRLYEVA